MKKRRNIGAFLKKSFCNCLRNPSGSEIRPVAVEMSDMLDQFKEVAEEMSRKVIEFLEEKMGMVGNYLEEVGIHLEEAWGNLVEEYFSGDDVAALQVIVLSKHLKHHPIQSLTLFQSLTLCPRPSSSALSFPSSTCSSSSLPYWIYHCVAGNIIVC